MILFEKIRWKNVLSTGNTFTEIQLNKNDTTLISGENGAGKTTLLDAIVFCLFGKPYRNINIPQLVNSINQKDCVTEITFDISGTKYEVRRGISPKYFEVYKDGKLIDQDANNKDYQKMFEDQILRMSYKSFCQVVILGSTNYVPFMRLSAAERRSVVENLLDIDVFSSMNILLKAKISTLKSAQKNIDNKLLLMKERAEAQKRYVKNLEIKAKSSTENFEQDIKTAQDAIDQFQKLNETLHLSVENLEKTLIGSRSEDLLLELSKIDGDIHKLEKEINFYANNDNCTRCKQDLCTEHKTAITSVLTTDIADNLARKEGFVSKLAVVIETQKKDSVVLSDIRTTQKKIQENNSNITANNHFIQKIKKDSVVGLDSEAIGVEQEKFDSIVQEGISITEERKHIVEDVHYHNIAASLLKDSGIKGKIIKHYLPIMNKVINKYLAQMDFFVQFGLSEAFEETIKSRHRDIFTYDSFSEGEKRKIDLALLFAWRKIAAIKNSLSCNLLIFDEVLDGSLDDAATESFLNILKGIGDKTNVFVISHKSKEILQDKFQEHITFVKKNNFSRML